MRNPLRRRLVTWLTTVAASAATLVGVSGTPAQAVVWSEPGYLRTQTDRCLQAVTNGVQTAPCSQINNRASFKWRMEIDGKHPGLVRFLLEGSGFCLDSNNVAVYHTPCEAEWIGQYWHLSNTASTFLWGNNSSRFMTGWDAGNVSMEPRGADQSAMIFKQVWRFDPV